MENEQSKTALIGQHPIDEENGFLFETGYPISFGFCLFPQDQLNRSKIRQEINRSCSNTEVLAVHSGSTSVHITKQLLRW